jgi:hypothetical protein
VYQAQFQWSDKFRYDFLVPPNILIELDGPQHFVPVRTWKSGFEVCDTDVTKEELASANHHHVIRLLQSDVWSDKDRWREFLAQSILDCQDAAQAMVITPDRKEYTDGIYRRLRCASFF